MANEKTEITTTEVVVAKGRSVQTPDGLFTEGKTVTLPTAEVTRLQQSGHIISDTPPEHPITAAQAADIDETPTGTAKPAATVVKAI
ncbi:MAG: hypothetical protein WCL60_01325 [Methylococcales bacterium]